MSATLYCGDALTVLRTLPDGLASCCVTSPPYWGLRDYGTAAWDGGDPACSHRGRSKPRNDTGAAGVENGRFVTTRGTQSSKAVSGEPVRDVCRCGARRVDRQLGLEPTPELYVERMVEVFREVRRVLADDGTLWCNLGDTYAGARSYQVPDSKHRDVGNALGMHAGPGGLKHGLKPKDLVGIPWMLAFALRADGWYLRSDIIWAKPNPMPESVRDRPTKAHEYLFLLSKRPSYYYDAEAIREPCVYPGDYGFLRGPVDGCDSDTIAWRAKSQRSRKLAGVDSKSAGRDWRNRRSVWTIAPQPFTGETAESTHFATFPPALVEPCVRAGSKPGDVVLDPFAGAWTTGLVARRLGRSAVGIELSPAYAEMGRRRVRDDAPLLNDVDLVVSP